MTAEDKIKNLFDYLNARKVYYVDFVRYESEIGNTRNADILDARANELDFVIAELLRIIINSSK